MSINICPTCRQPIGTGKAAALLADCICDKCGNFKRCEPGKLCNAALKADAEGKPLDPKKSGNCLGTMVDATEYADKKAGTTKSPATPVAK